ncbi:MAG: DUF4249 family protein [Bacteroidetes bacterium]|nr:DUF4249 family protein [Bacteroidota bacterium]
MKYLINIFFLFITLIGCKGPPLVKVPDLPTIPFIWSFYIEGNAKTYALAFALDDIYGEGIPIDNDDDFLQGDERYEISIIKNESELANFNHFIHLDTTTYIHQNSSGGFDTIYSIRRPVMYNYYADINPLISSETGDVFELSVKHPDYADMYARQEMPQKVPLKNFKLLGTEPFPNHFYRANIQISLKDPENNANYYQIASAVIPEDDNGNLKADDIDITPFNIGADDPEIIDYEPFSNRGAIYLADSSFDGQEKTISFWVEIREPKLPDNFYIIWRCISPEWYRFYEARRSTYGNYRISDDVSNALTQPYSLPFNIEEGFGIFGVATQELYKLN